MEDISVKTEISSDNEVKTNSKHINIAALIEKKKKARSIIFHLSEAMRNLKNILVDASDHQRVEIFKNTLEGEDFDNKVQYLLQLKDALKAANETRQEEVNLLRKYIDQDKKAIEAIEDSVASIMIDSGIDYAGGALRRTGVNAGKDNFEITDESKIKKKFKIPQPPKIDRAALKAEALSEAGSPGTRRISGKPYLVNR